LLLIAPKSFLELVKRTHSKEGGDVVMAKPEAWLKNRVGWEGSGRPGKKLLEYKESKKVEKKKKWVQGTH